MTDELLDRLDAIIERLAGPALPLADQLWDVTGVAKYLHCSPGYIQSTLACLSSFPKPLRLPAKGPARPLYYGEEVVQWARQFREKPEQMPRTVEADQVERNTNAEQIVAEKLPATGFVRQTDLVGRPSKSVRGILPFSPSTLWRKVADGTFPKPVKLSPGCTVWRVEQIREWMATPR